MSKNRNSSYDFSISFFYMKFTQVKLAIFKCPNIPIQTNQTILPCQQSLSFLFSRKINQVISNFVQGQLIRFQILSNYCTVVIHQISLEYKGNKDEYIGRTKTRLGQKTCQRLTQDIKVLLESTYKSSNFLKFLFKHYIVYQV